jgi:hypothetical protein
MSSKPTALNIGMTEAFTLDIVSRATVDFAA